MIHAWKYTLLRVQGNKVVPLIYSAFLPHDKTTRLAQHIMRDGEPFSAGFVQGLSIDRLFGHSESLNMGSENPVNDAMMINLYERGTNIWPQEKY